MGNKRRYRKGKGKKMKLLRSYNNDITKVSKDLDLKYINLELMKKVFHAPTMSFKRFGTKVLKSQHGPLIFRDNGAKILFVGHLDSVCQDLTFYFQADKGRIYNPQLDDRLGVYAGLYVLPALGLNYDLLLCDSEESGNSTASLFDKLNVEKEYNWIFEIDRAGTDVAIYQYENPEWRDSLRKHFGLVSSGSFTDIVELSQLGVCGVNISCGYYNNHGPSAFMEVDEFTSQIDKFVSFYNEYKDTKFEYDPKVHRRWYSSYGAFYTDDSTGYGSYNTYSNNSVYSDNFSSHSFGKQLLENIKMHVRVVKCDSCKSEIFTTDRDCPYCLAENEAFSKTVSVIGHCNCCEAALYRSQCVLEFGLCTECLEQIHDVPIDLIEIIEYFDILYLTEKDALYVNTVEEINKILKDFNQ